MAISHAKHFWNWFQRFNTSYLQLSDYTLKEREFWIREFHAHLRAYTKKLCFEIRLCKETKTAMLVISCRNDPKYMNMAEKLVAKAPVLANWHIAAFLPAGLLSDEEMCNREIEGINLEKMWFDADFRQHHKGRIVLQVYVEMYIPVTDDMRNAVWDRIANLIGEKALVAEVAWIALENWLEIPSNDRERLVRIDEISSYIVNRDGSMMRIDETGRLVLPETK